MEHWRRDEYLRDGMIPAWMNTYWRQIRQLATWHVMHQALSGTRDIKIAFIMYRCLMCLQVSELLTLPCDVMFKYQTFFVQKCDKLCS